MRRPIVLSLCALVVLLLNLPSAFPIVNGEPDQDGHPNVGLIIVTDTDPDYPEGLGQWLWCSGVLVNPDVFLTAGHCALFLQEWLATGEIDEIWVGFAPAPGWPPCAMDSGVVICPGMVRATSVVPHPDFVLNGFQGIFGVSGLPSDIDLGVILLENPVGAIAPASLPPLGYLDALRSGNGLHGAHFDVVGYGAHASFMHGPPAYSVAPLMRRTAVSEFLALAPGDLVLSQNLATGDGGACYADSGGGVFFGDPKLLVAVNSGGDGACRAVSLPLRLDTAQAREFLGQFVDLP